MEAEKSEGSNSNPSEKLPAQQEAVRLRRQAEMMRVAERPEQACSYRLGSSHEANGSDRYAIREDLGSGELG